MSVIVDTVVRPIIRHTVGEKIVIIGKKAATAGQVRVNLNAIEDGDKFVTRTLKHRTGALGRAILLSHRAAAKGGAKFGDNVRLLKIRLKNEGILGWFNRHVIVRLATFFKAFFSSENRAALKAAAGAKPRTT